MKKVLNWLGLAVCAVLYVHVAAHLFNPLSASAALDMQQCATSRRPHVCRGLVKRLNRMVDIPTCPAPPSCPRPDLDQRLVQTDTGAPITLFSGILTDPAYPACVGKSFFGNVPSATSTSVSVIGDCTGTLDMTGASHSLLEGPYPFIGSVSGTLHCDCCGDMPVNARFQP